MNETLTFLALALALYGCVSPRYDYSERNLYRVICVEAKQCN